MNCFELVQKVLDATYNEIEGTEAERDAAIRAALDGMTKTYRQDLVTDGGPDFNNPVTRFAYVFRYVPSHSHWLYELLSWSKEAGALFDNDKVRVTCLGGGPGSDLVGVLKFMARSGKSPTLFCEIVDGCIRWKHTWSDLTYELDLPTSVHTDYVIQNVGDEATWGDPSNFPKADLFTINFFGSEIFHLGDKAIRYLKGVFLKAKPGALFVYNDNNDDRFYGAIDGLAASSGLEVLRTGQGERKIFDREEQMSALGQYIQKFEARAKLTGQLAWRVLRKR